MAVDNLLSATMVTATGDLRTITPRTSPDLWFAIRGAGANFGIITSLTMRAYPVQDNRIWTGALRFEPAKIERLIEALDQLDLSEEGNVVVNAVFDLGGFSKAQPRRDGNTSRTDSTTSLSSATLITVPGLGAWYADQDGAADD